MSKLFKNFLSNSISFCTDQKLKFTVSSSGEPECIIEAVDLNGKDRYQVVIKRLVNHDNSHEDEVNSSFKEVGSFVPPLSSASTVQPMTREEAQVYKVKLLEMAEKDGWVGVFSQPYQEGVKSKIVLYNTKSKTFVDGSPANKVYGQPVPASKIRMLGADQFTRLENMFINNPTAVVAVQNIASPTSVNINSQVRDDKCLPSTIANANKIFSLLDDEKHGLNKQEIIQNLKLTSTEYDTAIDYLKRHKKVLLMGARNRYGRWITI
jgi:hypothetical protein